MAGGAARAARHIKLRHADHESRNRLDHQRVGRRQIEQRAAGRQFQGLMTARQRPVMANPLKPRRQHMRQKAADELNGRQPDGTATVCCAGVTHAERHLAIGKAHAP